ncbi:FluC/FEX family fluoride channel [Thermaurantiacus tibetensis]|uniref:FluC/FEX family fluoride channel n=1 Tax=Thermaurantiacus tibetensis TaxID=2759035 RepID=UPI00188EF1CE|nr:CrcB family protein [Thermaurantiacus tibetensis]
MTPFLLVGLGGALGACARYGVGRLVGAGLWPSATFAVNLAGGLLMGLLAGWLAARGGSEQVRLFLGVGLLGGFTTFSAFSLELWLLLEKGEWLVAAGYALASVVLAVAGLGLGLLLMRNLA